MVVFISVEPRLFSVRRNREKETVHDTQRKILEGERNDKKSDQYNDVMLHNFFGAKLGLVEIS